jgi:hypothetical protein
MALNIVVRVWLPSEGAVHVPWLLPTIEGALLVVLVASDPLEARLLGICTLGSRTRPRSAPLTSCHSPTAPKYAMLVQSTVALTLFGLVVARAVNAFT